MTIKNAMQKVSSLEKLSHGLDKLTKIFQDDKELAEKLADKGGIPMPLVTLLMSSRAELDLQGIRLQEKIDKTEMIE